MYDLELMFLSCLVCAVSTVGGEVSGAIEGSRRAWNVRCPATVDEFPAGLCQALFRTLNRIL